MVKAISVQHVNTAMSILNDIEKLRAAIDDVDHPALLCVDVFASLACDLYEIVKWSDAVGVCMIVSDPTKHSHSVASVEAKHGIGTKLQNWVKQNVGPTLGRGLGMADETDPDCHDFFRFGQLGHVNGHMIMGALGAIDAGFNALDILHGTGALDAASCGIAVSKKHHDSV